MYSRRYVIKSINEFGRHNYIYDDVEGCICYPAYLKVGERGWFLYEPAKFDLAPVHRIHTSVVQSIGYTSNEIVVVTENTKFVFKVAEDIDDGGV